MEALKLGSKTKVIELDNKKKSYVIEGRRWRDSYGNTYHSVTIYADGEQIAYEPFTYGYDSMWQYTALEMLHKLGIAKRYAIPWKWAAEYGKAYVHFSVSDVKCKKDL